MARGRPPTLAVETSAGGNSYGDRTHGLADAGQRLRRPRRATVHFVGALDRSPIAGHVGQTDAADVDYGRESGTINADIRCDFSAADL